MLSWIILNFEWDSFELLKCRVLNEGVKFLAVRSKFSRRDDFLGS